MDVCKLVRKNTDVNEHKRLSTFILRHKLKYRNSDIFAVLQLWQGLQQCNVC